MALDKARLLEFLGTELGVDVSEVDEDTPLFSSGLIDSASLVELVVFVETEGQVRFGPEDVTLENLDSIARILRFVGNGREAGHG